jgi:hypothetical protein
LGRKAKTATRFISDSESGSLDRISDLMLR